MKGFKDFVLDQLAGLESLRAKRMFGGHGLYQADRFFRILMENRVYFKTDSRSRADYLARGAEPFTYEKGRRIVSLNYYEVPSEVLEDRDAILIWARRAIQVKASRSAKRKKKTKRLGAPA